MLSLLPLVETAPDEDGWRFVRRVVYGMEWDGLREIAAVAGRSLGKHTEQIFANNLCTWED